VRTASVVVVVAIAGGQTLMACSRPKEVAGDLAADTRLLGAFGGRVYWANAETLSWTDDTLEKPESYDVVGVDWAERANFAADASSVYFSHHNKVSHVPTRGNADRNFVPNGWMISPPAEHPTGIAVEGTSVYVLGLDVECFNHGAVIGLARETGSLLFRRDAPANGGQPVEFSVDGDFYYWIDGRGSERESSRRDPKVMALPRQPGPAMVVAEREGAPTDLHVGSRGVYWRTHAGIRFAAKGPSGFGAASTLVSDPIHGSPPAAITSLLVDADDVFFTAGDGVYALSKGSSEPRRLAEQPGAHDLVTDGRFLYWLRNSGDGTARSIVRVRRP